MKYIRNSIPGVVGGVLLFIADIFTWYIPLFGAERFSLALHLCILFSVFVAFFSIAYKYVSIYYSVLRTAIMFASYICISVLYVQLGAGVYLDGLLNIVEDLESGLLIALVLYITVIVSILANVIVPIWKWYRRKTR